MEFTRPVKKVTKWAKFKEGSQIHVPEEYFVFKTLYFLKLACSKILKILEFQVLDLQKKTLSLNQYHQF